MSAQDHLNHQQFMPLKEIDNLQSSSAGGTVADFLPKLRSYETPQYQENIRKDMEESGQREPLVVNSNMLDDGHHRVLAAHDLGWDGLMVTRT
jgi:hypothetical protein